MALETLLLNVICGIHCVAAIPTGMEPNPRTSLNPFPGALNHQGNVSLMVTPEFTSALSLYEYGVKLHQADQFLDAIAAYEQAIVVDPTFDSAYINLGLAYIQLEQWELATTVLNQVLMLPDRVEFPASIHSLAHYNLAIISNRQENFPEAIAQTQSALNINPEFNPAQELLQQLQGLQ